MAPHPGLLLFFEPLVLGSRVMGPFKPSNRVDSTGVNGNIQYEMTGERGGTWHCIIDERGASFGRGPLPDAKSTVTMTTDTFFALLRGETSSVVAQMTGKVRVRGDGYAGMIFGATVAQFRSPPKQPGAQGLFMRAWRRGVLAAIGGRG